MCIIRIKLIAAANRLNITAADYGCSFAAKPNLEKKIFFLKKYLCFYKIFIFCRKSCFYMEKSLKWKKIFTEKNFFYREKLYLISKIYIYTENICVTNKIRIYIHSAKKKFWPIFVKTSLGTQ